MKIVVGSDFSGYPLKEEVKKYLIEKGLEIKEVGQIGEVTESNKVVYPNAARAVAAEILSGNAERGLVCCGSGAGVSITCNKFKGIYAVACESQFTAERLPYINQANVLAMGSNVVTPSVAFEMIDAWLIESFPGNLAPERAAFLDSLLDIVKSIEDENFK